MSYFYNNVQITPGAYLVNGNSSTNNAMYQLPIFSSISSLTKMGYQNIDDICYVLPGYKIELYSSVNYVTLSETIDNNSGTKILYTPTASINNCESIKMYCNNNEITEKYTYTAYQSNTGAPTIPTDTSTIGPYNISNLSLFPGAYIIDSTENGCMAIFFSIVDFSSFLANTGDRENYVLVMPGYRLILYFNITYTGNYVDIDNTTGTTIIVGQSNTNGYGGWDNDNISSCKLFFNGKEFTQANLVSVGN